MKITSTADLGKVIRSKRKKLGYTQAQLSEYTGFSTSFISDLENGKETAVSVRKIRITRNKNYYKNY